MLFHTYVFALFFAVALAGHALLRRTRLGIAWLLAVSCVFYGWWSPVYLLPMAWSTVVDWAIGLRLPHARRKRAWLAVSLASNLGLLGWFKYVGFAVDNVNGLARAIGLEAVLSRPDVILPVGISFYTFQSIGYVVDVYRGALAPEKSLVRFAAFVTFFPQLVAGPIERADRLLPQLRRMPGPSRDGIAAGASLFLVGLFKKVAVADLLAGYVDRVYGAPALHGSAALAAATFAFAWQIYFDFSGYTDMARGVARGLGFELMENFRAPYLADSLTDFWRRWHLSLSTWFRDYLYRPLGGNRGGRAETERNLAVTFLVSGLWHGAAWTFVAWGGLHALGLVVERRLRGGRLGALRLPRLVRQTLVFGFVCLAWVFFRARSLGDAATILSRIASGAPGDPRFPAIALLLCAAVWLYQHLEARPRARPLAAPARIGLAASMLLYLTFFTTSANQPFVYFQF